MRKATLFLASCLAACSLLGQGQDSATLPLQTEETWQVFLNAVPVKNYYKALPSAMKSADGTEVAPKAMKMQKDGGIDLAAIGGEFQTGACALLYNEFQSPRDGVMQAGASADWWMEIYVNGKQVLTTMAKGNNSCGGYKAGDHVFTFPVVKGKNLIAARVNSGSAGWRFVYGKPEAPKPNIHFEANDEWRPANMESLYIKAGTALDQSALAEIPLVSTGLLSSTKSLPRLTIGPTGKLVAEDHPDTPIRLKGSSYNGGWLAAGNLKQFPDMDWKEVYRREIVDFKRQGYNLMRLGVTNRGSFERSFSPANMEQADFMAAELAANGIYHITDCSYYLRNGWDPGESRLDHALRMYLGEESVREAWRKGAEYLMNHVNPYTGLAWKDDPSLACIIANNEQEHAVYKAKSSQSEQTQLELDVKFRQWLENKYKEPKELAKAWSDKSLTSFAKVFAPENFPAGGGKQVRDNDYVLFWIDLSQENARWMERTLRAAGYKGLISLYNISHWLGGQEARWETSQVTIANTYHCHPSSFETKGSHCGQQSSVGEAGSYWRGIASMRFADRPFIETEFNHAFWNPYQYECGPLFCGYSALQGLDALMIHSEPVFYFVDRSKGVSVFCVGRSPVSRAGEFLSNFIYLRGDIKPSPHRVELQYSKEYVETKGHGGATVSPEQNKIALMTGFSIAFPWAKPAAGVGTALAPDLVLPPADGAEMKSAGGGWAVEVVSGKDSTFSLDAAVESMKGKGLLPKDNLSQPSKGIFQSDTGELTMRTKENLLKIVTPRSEAVTLEASKGEKLGQLNVLKVSVPGMIAACAIDKEPLKDSKRIVLLFSTETVNTGMELSNDRVTLVDLGKPPVLIRSGKLDATLTNSNGAKMSLYALGFDGARREKLPVTFDGKAVNLSIDLRTLKDGPTPFFELVEE